MCVFPSSVRYIAFRLGFFSVVGICAVHPVAHLVEACSKQVERGEDSPIRPKVILLHDILVVHLHEVSVVSQVQLVLCKIQPAQYTFSAAAESA